MDGDRIVRFHDDFSDRRGGSAIAADTHLYPRSAAYFTISGAIFPMNAACSAFVAILYAPSVAVRYGRARP